MKKAILFIILFLFSNYSFAEITPELECANYFVTSESTRKRCISDLNFLNDNLLSENKTQYQNFAQMISIHYQICNRDPDKIKKSYCFNRILMSIEKEDKISSCQKENKGDIEGRNKCKLKAIKQWQLDIHDLIAKQIGELEELKVQEDKVEDGNSEPDSLNESQVSDSKLQASET